jgi:hypothetical protein
MLQKITLSIILLLFSACAKEREVEEYPYVIPPIIQDDYPEIFKIFHKKSKS